MVRGSGGLIPGMRSFPYAEGFPPHSDHTLSWAETRWACGSDFVFEIESRIHMTVLRIYSEGFVNVITSTSSNANGKSSNEEVVALWGCFALMCINGTPIKIQFVPFRLMKWFKYLWKCSSLVYVSRLCIRHDYIIQIQNIHT